MIKIQILAEGEKVADSFSKKNTTLIENAVVIRRLEEIKQELLDIEYDSEFESFEGSEWKNANVDMIKIATIVWKKKEMVWENVHTHIIKVDIWEQYVAVESLRRVRFRMRCRNDRFIYLLYYLLLW